MCSNPLCTSRRRHFLSKNAFGIHLQRSTTCFCFLQQQQMHADSDGKPTAPQSLNAHTDSVQAAPQVQYSSTSFAGTRLLKRDFTNIFSDEISQQGATLAVLDDNKFCTPIHSDQTRATMGAVQMHTTELKWTVALLKILNSVNAPDYAFF